MDVRSLPTAVPDRPRRSRLALLQFLLACFDAQSDSVQVVQVGANDGKLDDPILPYWSKPHWKGVLNEPRPLHSGELSRRHSSNPNLTLVNVAISDAPGQMKLYHLDEKFTGSYPGWLRGCASLSKDRVAAAIDRADLKKGSEVPHSVIAVAEVSVQRLDAVLAETGIRTADVLIIDVEGHDLSVLHSFDLNSLGLSLAIVEFNAGDRAERDAIVSLLNTAGLVAYQIGNDVVAFRPASVTIPIEAMFHFNNLVPLGVEAAAETKH